jgi:hypothetical protein
LNTGNAGTPVMTLTVAGNVGIGTSSPASQLTVGDATANPAATVSFFKGTASEYRLKLTSSGFNTDGAWLGLGFGYSDNYMKAAIIAEAKDANGRANFHFALNDAASSANAGLSDSKMVLTYSGNLGLGVTPSAWSAGKGIEVGFAGNAVYSYSQTDFEILSNAYYNSGYKFGGTGRAMMYAMGTAGSGIHSWHTSTASGDAGDPISFTQAMTLDASGNLGVGLANPSTYGKLSVNGNIAQYGNVAIGSELGRIAWFNTATGYDVASIRTFIGAGQINRGEFGFYTNNGAVQNLAMYIDRVQQVTVGATSTPIGQLGSKLSDVTTTFANLSYGMLGLQNTSNTANNYTWMTFNESNGNYTGAIGTQNITHATASSTVVGDMVFATKQSGIGGFPTEKVRITSAGNFGVGENNPTFKLDVKTTANNIAAFESQASSYPSSSIYNAVIGRGTNIIPPSTTTTLAAWLWWWNCFNRNAG